MAYCPSCGFNNQDGAAYCARCGAILGTGTQRVQAGNTYVAQNSGAIPVQQTVVIPVNTYTPPAIQHRTNRGLLKSIIFNFLTFGIYSLVMYTHMADELNIVASRHDGKHTMNYLLMIFIVGPITCGIYSLIWGHQFYSRIGNELSRRGIRYDFSASDFWLWGILGSLIVIGPFISTYKLLKAMNYINADYNMKG